MPPTRSEQELQEEEELQLAIALSKSEAETKEKNKVRDRIDWPLSCSDIQSWFYVCAQAMREGVTL